MSLTVELSPIGLNVLDIDTWNPQHAAPDAEFDYIDIASVDRDTKSITGTSRISASEAPSRARQIVKENDVIVSTVRPNLNAVALVPEHLENAIASTGFCVLRCHPKRMSHRYLFHWIRTEHFIAEMVRRATGASYPAVSDRIIKEAKIPLPPLPEQQRIAAILDKAAAIRLKRHSSSELAGHLVQTTFFKMFGDPVANSRRWPQTRLSSYGQITTGNTPPRSHPGYYGDAIEWIKSDNINTPHHFLTRSAEGLSPDGLKVGRWVPSGSTLVTCIAGSPDCIGNAALADREVAFNQQINAITPSPRTDPYFLYVLILTSKRLIQLCSSEAMKGMVSKGRFEAIQVIDVPSESQKEFGHRFHKLIGLMNRLNTASSNAEALFASLTGRAFCGEL